MMFSETFRMNLLLLLNIEKLGFDIEPQGLGKSYSMLKHPTH